MLPQVRRRIVVEARHGAELGRNSRHHAFAYRVMVELPPVAPFPQMAVLLNLDAVEHGPGRHAGTLKTFSQFDMLMVARPLAQMGVERVAILPARELVGEFRLARPRRI